jgi:hypothetical protein
VDDAGGHRTKLNVTGNYNTVGILQENDGGIGSNGHFMDVDVNGNSTLPTWIKNLMVTRCCS